MWRLMPLALSRNGGQRGLHVCCVGMHAAGTAHATAHLLNIMLGAADADAPPRMNRMFT